MKYLILFFLLPVCCTMVSGQDYPGIVAQAEAHYENKAYAESAAAYKQAFKIEQKSPLDLYNAACSAALAGQRSLALKWLDRAVQRGWTNARHLRSDTDLNALHGSKKWEKIAAQAQAALDKIEANYDKPLQAELLQIFDDDQKYRRQLGELEQKHGWDSPEVQALWQTIHITDSINQEKVIAILDKHGWVGPDKVGGQANQAIFLVIQHASLAIQQKYLPMMREAVQQKRANASALALLEDRVALGEGRKQVYGSQIGFDEATGQMYVLPLEDPDHVDERRAAMGLGPIADYVKRWNINWDVEAYKKWLTEKEAGKKD